MEGLEKGLFEINKINNFKEWEICTKKCFVFNDSVIIIELDENRELSIQVIDGKCITIDVNLDL